MLPNEPRGGGRKGHAASLEYHRILLDDHHRLDAYDRAIRNLVRPGDVVLDLGAGTGVLAMLAARRRAGRVYAIESMAVAGLASELVRANHFEDTVVVQQSDIRELEPPEPVDLVVSDFMGRFVVDDDMLDAVRAAGRWLKPDGRFCPSRVAMMLAPAGDFHMWCVDFFDYPVLGLDLTAARYHALRFFYMAELRPHAIMATPRCYCSFDPPHVPDGFDHTVEFRIVRPGQLRALAGWFEATLAPEVLLSTAPGVETHWGQILFPLPPTWVEPGDELVARLWLERLGERFVWHWAGEVRRGERPTVAFELESDQRLDLAPVCRDNGPR